MSTEAYAELRFAAASHSHGFLDRLRTFGVDLPQVAVVSDATPVGEALARVDAGGVLAVLDEDAPQGFALVRIAEVDR